MARNAIVQQFPPSNAPLLNSDGTLSQVWYQFLVTVHNREGGSQDDIYSIIIAQLVQSTQFQQLSGQFSDVDDRFAEIEARLQSRFSIDDQIDDLRAQIESLTQIQSLIQQQLQASDTEAEVQQLEAQVLALSQFGFQATSLNDLNARIDDLTTDQVAEGTINLYFTVARARTSISVAGSLSYNSTTGVISYTTPSNSATASAWATPRNLSFTGNVSGSLTGVDGSASVAGTLTIGAGQVTTAMLAFTLATVATSGDYNDLLNKPVGAYTATIITPTGYMNITDSGGTIRRVLVG